MSGEELRERRERLMPSKAASNPPPQVDAEYVVRHLGRRNLKNRQLADLLGVSEVAVGHWANGRPIPIRRQRELMDLFGEPLSLQDATMQELVAEVMRRVAQ